MPNSIIKSFARQSGRTEEDVDKMWNDVKKSVEKQGYNGDSLYARVVGILKKNLKI